jgi:hypothetical protein
MELVGIWGHLELKKPEIDPILTALQQDDEMKRVSTWSPHPKPAADGHATHKDRDIDPILIALQQDNEMKRVSNYTPPTSAEKPPQQKPESPEERPRSFRIIGGLPIQPMLLKQIEVGARTHLLEARRLRVSHPRVRASLADVFCIDSTSICPAQDAQLAEREFRRRQSAAVVVESAVRGLLDRLHVQEMRAVAAAAAKMLQDAEEALAASRLQKVARGRSARAATEHKKAEAKATKAAASERSMQRSKAAVKLQSLSRGHTARAQAVGEAAALRTQKIVAREAEAARKEKDERAATIVQAMERSRVARSTVAFKRERRKRRSSYTFGKDEIGLVLASRDGGVVVDQVKTAVFKRGHVYT